jgi:hypothetical protein
MKLVKINLFIAAVFTVQMLNAATTPRIDLQGLKGEVQFKDLKTFGSDKSKITLAKWKWVKGDSYILASFIDLKSKVWTKVGLKFTPTSDGQVKLMLLGNRERNREGIIYYDDLEVKGTNIINPDFEEIDPGKNLPIMWNRMNVMKGVEALAGFSREYKENANISALVHHDSRLYQIITVKKNKPVIIEAWVYIP